MLLAVNIGDVALFVYTLGLFYAIENPIRSALFYLAVYVTLHRKAGSFFVDANMCMFDYRHSQTNELVWKGLRILTNAPWMILLGRRCDGSHRHTKLTGKFTTDSAAYNWTFSLAYARLVSSAPHWLKMYKSMRKYWRVDSNVFQVSRIALDDHYPNFPLTFFTGDLDEARRTCIPIDTIPTMAPIHGADGPDKVTEKENEFALQCQWLRDQGVPADKVTFASYKDGTEQYVVHFPREIVDIRDLREKKSMHFAAFGKDHRLALGYEKASALAYLAYAASRLNNP